MSRSFATAALLLSGVLISGCVSETVRAVRPRKGPVPEVGWVDFGGGEVRYSSEGWPFVLSLRRRGAFHRMKHICKGLKPRITDEFTHQDVDVPFASDDLKQHMVEGVNHYTLASYHHVIFECRPTGSPDDKASAAPPLQAGGPKAKP